MLRTFTIRNFRLFEEVDLPTLSRVNLFVGKNGTGKSALLEAIYLYLDQMSSGGFRSPMRALLRILPDPWKASLSEPADRPQALAQLFNGRRLPEPGEPGIYLSPHGASDRQLRLQTAAYRTISDGDELWTVRVLPEDLDRPDSEATVYLNFEKGDVVREIRRIFPVSGVGNEGSGSGLSVLPTSESEAQFVSTRGTETPRLAELWDEVSLTPLEEEVIAGLRLIEPAIEDLAFIEAPGAGRQRVPIVRLEGSVDRIPLASMGDGLQRLLQVILSLVNVSRGSALLIDEIENGLHWSVQPEVWKILFRLSERLDVQVFATTHSRDCVEAFERAWREDPDAGTFYRLSRTSDGVRPVAYDLETLGDAMVTDVEVR